MSNRVNLITDFMLTFCTLYRVDNKPKIFSLERERIPVFTRLAVGICVAVFVWFTADPNTNDAVFGLTLLQTGILAFLAGSLALGAHLWLYRIHSVSRQLLSIALDVSAISGALYLGAGTIDPIAVFYLWIMLGSGMVFGVRYLYFSSFLALSAFGLVYVASPYWQSQPMFAATIAGLILFLSPYLAMLLQSLERSRNEAIWQADHDGLTAVLNRRAFERELSLMMSDTQTVDANFLLYMDLDKFKIINDKAGHAAGDKALIDVARIFKANTKNDDLLARMGGDEFCMLLVGQTLEEARRRSEKIRNDVAAYRLAWGTNYYTLGVSVGVVSAAACIADGEALIRLADAACYVAKNNGRNQVHVIDTHTDTSDTQAIRTLVLPIPATTPKTNVVNINQPRELS